MSESWRSEIFLSDVREALRNKEILIAGCGADGSHAADALAKISMAEVALDICDPDKYSEGNIGIQVADKADIGVNKAVVTCRRLKAKYPYMRVKSFPNGVTEHNLPKLLENKSYVVDALDISVTALANKMHRQAAERNIPVVVPWSLGMGAAIMVCQNAHEFEEWGKEASKIAHEENMSKYAEIARWLVYLPKGLNREVIDAVIEGKANTPTTFFGAALGGHLASRWISAHAIGGTDIPYFPNTFVARSELLEINTHITDYREVIRKNLQSLRDC